MQNVLCADALPREIVALSVFYYYHHHHHLHPFIVIVFGLSHKYYVTAARRMYQLTFLG
jgi:hypothetical protein